MTSEMSITQDFRQLTLTLSADMVTINLDVKMLKGQYMYSLNNNYTSLSFTPWSGDHEPSEMFMRIVREIQIIPNSYYLETVMDQSLTNNFAINCHQPKVKMVEQDVPQDNKINTQRQSPCSSNWNDYLHVEDDIDNESTCQADPPAEGKRYYFYIVLLDQMVSAVLYNLTPGRGLTQPWCEPSP